MAEFRRQMEDKDKKNFAGMIIIVVILLLFALFLVLFH